MPSQSPKRSFFTFAMRSLSIPLGLAAFAVALSTALLVGWTLLLVQNLLRSDDVAQSVWLLSTGSISFLIIMSVLVMFSIFLVRESAEVRRQNSFIDSVTHELKSPLASLRLGLETLGRKGISDDQSQMLRQMMLDDVDRLSIFIDGILDASRIQQGRYEPDPPIELSLKSLIEQCAALMIAHHHIDPSCVHIDIDPSRTLVADRTALQTIFKNIIDNAIKYSDPSPSITITASNAGGDMLRCDVIDHGIGIAPEDLNHVFDRFYRAPGEAVRSRRGTGLGLHVVHTLVRNLGGHITVTSEGTNLGTTVTLVLPNAPR